LRGLVGECHGLRKLAETCPEPRGEDGAEFGRHETACRSFEQRLAKLLFCPLDLLADGAGGHVEFARRSRKRSQSGDGFHGAQAVEVHTVQHGHIVFLNRQG